MHNFVKTDDKRVRRGNSTKLRGGYGIIHLLGLRWRILAFDVMYPVSHAEDLKSNVHGYGYQIQTSTFIA